MKYIVFISSIAALLGLTACDRQQPPAPVVVQPLPVPGPAGPAGATGATGSPGSTGTTGITGATGTSGMDGSKGDPGRPGSDTTVIVAPPAASAPKY